MDKNFVFLDDQQSGQQMMFRAPEALITAHSSADVPAAFIAIKTAQKSGKWLAGWVDYELGYSLEPRFQLTPDSEKNQRQSKRPLICLGVFDAPQPHPPANWLYRPTRPEIKFTPRWSEADYLQRFNKVQDFIQSGDCYQVNLTFPLFAQSDISPQALYAAFRQRQTGRYGGVTYLDDTPIVSFSPELFFEKSGNSLRMRPMKGTTKRLPNISDDREAAAQMRKDPKSQAENLMIVDLLRNDLSRLCQAGSVKVPDLFTIETYPTLHQMTSQITGELRPDISQDWESIFRGLFPCGSVTGAPKIRAMEIIQELESGPREAYCGAMGFIAPNGDACFSVAIRTVQMSKSQTADPQEENKTWDLRYDVGSGIVADSNGPDEYKESILKAQIFAGGADEAGQAIETFRRPPDGSLPDITAHFLRAIRGLNLNDEVSSCVFTDTIEQIKATRPNEDLRIRLLIKAGQPQAELSFQAESFTPISEPLTLALSRHALDPTVQISGFKTAHRDFYDGERQRIKALCGADEVLFFNKNTQICEGSFTSVFIERNGKFLTPPLSCGILPGILRAKMIETGQAVEALLSAADLQAHLQAGDQIWVGNALRGLMRAQLLDMTRY